MRKIKLKIKKKGCEGTCPIPLELIPTVVKGITQIKYDEKSEVAEILYDEKTFAKEGIIDKLVKTGYDIVGEAND